jgi:HAD superfamily hydrolase (TIGR01509 family)
MKTIEAVIFDMDGVLSDTQKFHVRVEQAVLAEYGIDITEEEIIHLYAGSKDSTQFTNEFKKHSIYADPEEAVRKKWLEMGKIKPEEITAIPGVIDFIDSLDKNLKLAVASGTKTKFVKSILNTLNITDRFIAIAGGDLVTIGKPDPELFLLTAKMMGVDPKNCVVIEDATNGVMAAKNAGMKCIAITTTHRKEELKSADKIIHSFKELTPDIIYLL